MLRHRSVGCFGMDKCRKLRTKFSNFEGWKNHPTNDKKKYSISDMSNFGERL